MKTTFDEYSSRYTHVAMRREAGVLEMRLHSEDGPLVWGSRPHSELGYCFADVGSDPDNQVIILTGTGERFLADLDKSWVGEMTPTRWDEIYRNGKRLLMNLLEIEVPMIAAVNGFALAGGWSIAQMCDLRIASEEAKLGISETKWSLLPPFGSILSKQIPLSAVLELVLTAQPVTAQRAYDMGFLNKVVPAGDLMEEAMTMAQQIADNAPLAVQTFKELAYRGLNMSNQDISALTYQMYDALLLTEDSKEGPKAFAEKRKPEWKGR